MQLLKQYNFLIEKTMIVCSQDIGVYGMDQPFLPLAGLRVVEMSHMIMGPSCGMFLGFLGAEVIKVEPPGGDKTRSLNGMGRPMFPLFNRGKKRSEEHTSELQSLMRISYAVFCLKKKQTQNTTLAENKIKTTRTVSHN